MLRKKTGKTSEEDNFVGLFLPQLYEFYLVIKAYAKKSQTKTTTTTTTKNSEAEKLLKPELFLSIKPRGAKQEISSQAQLYRLDSQHSH